MEQASKNNKSQPKTQSEPSHDSRYFTVDPIDKETLKQRIAEDEKVTKKSQLPTILVGIIIMFLSIPVYLVSDWNARQDCGTPCWSFLPAFFFSSLVFLFGLIFTIVSIVRMKKNRNGHTISAKTSLYSAIRWFFIIILAIIDYFLFYIIAVTKKNKSTQIPITEILSAVALLLAIILLILYPKIKERFLKK